MHCLRPRRDHPDAHHRRIAGPRRPAHLHQRHGPCNRIIAGGEREEWSITMQTTTTHSKDDLFPFGGEHRIFLGSDWVESGEQVEIRFPYDRSLLVGRVAWDTPREVEAALTVAGEAHGRWRAGPCTAVPRCCTASPT